MKERLEELTLLLKDPEKKSQAFEEIVKLSWTMMWSQAFSILKNEEDAEDAMQDALVKAWTNIDRFRGDSAISTWLYRIVTNCALTSFTRRKNRNQYTVEVPDYFIDYTVKAPITIDGDKAIKALNEAIETLPEKQKIVFKMRYYDALPYEEISRICGTSVGALKASYHHASKKIEAYIEDLEIDSY